MAWHARLSPPRRETTVGGNPGTEDQALVDLALLSHCQSLVVSSSSSFGGCASGLGGHHPYYLSGGSAWA